MKRTLSWLARSLLLAALLVLALVLVAIYTPAGTRFALWALGDAVELSAVQGSLGGPLRVERLVYDRAGLRIEIEELRMTWAPLRLLGGYLALDQAEAARVRVQLRDAPAGSAGGRDFAGLPIAIAIGQARVRELIIERVGAAPVRFGNVELAGHWAGTRIVLTRFAAVTETFGALTLSLRANLEREALAIEELALTGPGEAWLSGRYAWAGTSDLAIQWRALRWPFTGTPQLESPQGSGEWRGTPDDYTLALRGDVRVQAQDIAMEAAGHGSRTQLTLESFRGALLGGAIDGQARIGWVPSLAIDAQGRLQNLDPARYARDWPGRINGSFAATTQLAAGVPDLRFELLLADSTLRGYPLKLVAHGHYTPVALAFDRFELASGASRLEARGTVWPTLDATARLSSSNLASLWPDLGGSGDLNASAQGSYDAVRAQLKGRATNLAWADYRARSAVLDARIDLAGRSRATLELGEARRGERILRSVALTLDGRAEQHRFDLRASGADSAATLAFEGAMDLAQRRWSGRLMQGRLSLPPHAAWTLERAAPLTLAAGEQKLGQSCWTSAPARACFELEHAAGGTRTRFELREFALATLAPLLPPDWSLSGSVEAHGQASLGAAGLSDLREVDVRISSSAGHWRIGERSVLEFQPLKASLVQERERLRARAHFPFAQGLVELDATLAAAPRFEARPLTGTLKVRVPRLDWLQLLSREIESASGRIDGELQLQGVAGAPRAEGRLALREGRMRIARAGIELTQVEATLTGGNVGQQLKLQASARSGEGTIEANGEFFFKPAPDLLRATLRGENFQAANLAELRATISPDLALHVTGTASELTGSVRVPFAEITPLTFDKGIAPSGDQRIVLSEDEMEAKEGLRPLRARILLVLGDEVRFEGRGLKTRLTGELALTDEPGRPTTASGQVNLVGGRYKAYGQDLSIETGRLLFNGGAVTEPAVEIRATRKPRDEILVGVYVRGKLSAPEFDLFSTPAMPQESQLSWLVLGRPLDSSGSSQDRSVLAGAALSLGLSGSDFLAQRLQGNLKLDEISIGTRPGEAAETAKLTLGKYLSPRLFVSYGFGLFQSGQVLRLLYDLGHGFKLQTESGVQSGGDVLYSIER